jgi:phage/plasmid-associated DNA primase
MRQVRSARALIDGKDHVGHWLAECCEEDMNFTVLNARVWQSWVTWAERRGLKIGSQETLHEKLEGKEFKRRKYAGQRGWYGFRVCEDTLFEHHAPHDESQNK